MQGYLTTIGTRAPDKGPSILAARPTDRPARRAVTEEIASLSQGILQRVAAGDASAINECVDTYGDLIWSLARRFLRSQEDAEDVVQEVYIDLWSHAGRFDPSKGSETTFVATIARRRMIDRLRKITRQPVSAGDVAEMGDVLEDYRAVDAAAESDVEKAQAVIQGLKPQQQEVLRLSIYEGYSHGDIAELMEMPLGTVKTLLRRGLIKIRDELNSVEPGREALS